MSEKTHKIPEREPDNRIPMGAGEIEYYAQPDHALYIIRLKDGQICAVAGDLTMSVAEIHNAFLRGFIDQYANSTR